MGWLLFLVVLGFVVYYVWHNFFIDYKPISAFPNAEVDEYYEPVSDLLDEFQFCQALPFDISEEEISRFLDDGGSIQPTNLTEV